MQLSLCFDGDIIGSVRREREEPHQPHEYSEPVQDARLGDDGKCGPERFEEIAGLIQGHTTHHIAESGSEENGQQNAADGKD